MATVGALGSSAVQSQIATVEARLEAPITQLKSEITTDNAQISAWGTVKGTIASLATALSGISNVSSLSARSVASTSSAVSTATATNSAQAGTYNLTDVTRAKAQSLYSGLKASASASIGASAGSLTFVQNGKTETISVGSGSLTLNGLAAAINKAQDGVSASVINSTAGARLILQGSATGLYNFRHRCSRGFRLQSIQQHERPLDSGAESPERQPDAERRSNLERDQHAQ
jgi:flagellar hook-associated protein 2